MSKQYDIVLLGATGYTGKYCAEHITTHLPTDLKWAVAGRSATKLQAVVDEVKTYNPDRVQPAIETVSLDKEELKALISKTKVVLNTIGPYHIYSEPVVAACAETGAHYLDVTGETPWVRAMMLKYDAVAKKFGSILISQNGVESAPSDLLAYMMAQNTRSKLNAHITSSVGSVHEMSAVPSGGTLSTVLTLIEDYSFSKITKGTGPNALMPSGTPKPQLAKERQPSLLSKLIGVRSVSDLGTLTTSITAATNEAIVYKSAALMPELYGKTFTYEEFMRARNALTGTALHFALIFGSIAVALPPIRWLIRKFIFAPGQGPDRAAGEKERIEMRGLATIVYPDGVAPEGKPSKATAKFAMRGSMYYVTGVFLAQAAMTLLKDEQCPALGMGGGYVTPAALGMGYVERLREAGMVIEAGFL